MTRELQNGWTVWHQAKIHQTPSVTRALFVIPTSENHKWMAINWICNYSAHFPSPCVFYVARGENEKVTALISPYPLSLRSPEERWSQGVYERENKNETAMAGGETICLHSWHSGMIIHFNDKTWDKGFVRPRTHSRTHTRAWEPSAIADALVALAAHSLSQNPRKRVTTKSSEWAGVGWARGRRVRAEGPVGNYVRRQFGGNQREIWGGLGAEGS